MSVSPARLVVVDDDDMLRDVLVGNLTEAGYQVAAYGDPTLALAALTHGGETADLVILDWKMPEMSGLDLLQRLRSAGIGVAALFFTSYNDTLYEEAALSCGAVDFVDKTRSFAILKRRIELILARHEGGQAVSAAPDERVDQTAVGALVLDERAHRVTWRSHPITLTFGEYRVVCLLATAGRDLSYRDLYDALKGENFAAGDGPDGYRANVRALIKRIREKFIAADPGFDAIANYPGFGYRWTASEGKGPHD